MNQGVLSCLVGLAWAYHEGFLTFRPFESDFDSVISKVGLLGDFIKSN